MTSTYVSSFSRNRKFLAQAMPDFSEIKVRNIFFSYELPFIGFTYLITLTHAHLYIVPAKRICPFTEPDTPSIVKRRRMNNITSTSKKDEKEKDESHVIKARPDNVFIPRYPLRSIEIQPFSFEEQDKEKPTLVKKILQKGAFFTVFEFLYMPFFSI